MFDITHKHTRHMGTFSSSAVAIKVLHQRNFVLRWCVAIMLKFLIEQSRRANTGNRLRPTMDVEFAIDILQVPPNRANGDDELLCNVLVRVSSGDQREYFQLTCPEWLQQQLASIAWSRLSRRAADRGGWCAATCFADRLKIVDQRFRVLPVPCSHGIANRLQCRGNPAYAAPIHWMNTPCQQSQFNGLLVMLQRITLNVSSMRLPALVHVIPDRRSHHRPAARGGTLAGMQMVHRAVIMWGKASIHCFVHKLPHVSYFGRLSCAAVAAKPSSVGFLRTIAWLTGHLCVSLFQHAACLIGSYKCHIDCHKTIPKSATARFDRLGVFRMCPCILRLFHVPTNNEPRPDYSLTLP